jgi:hypothetical protein
MKTTKLGLEIVKSAEQWLAERVIEDYADNRDKHGKIAGLWTEYLTGNYKPNPNKKKNDAYCAITATVIVDRAVRNYALANNIFGAKNPVRHAAAANLIKIAEAANVRTAGVDSKNKATLDPIPGCMFVVKSSSASGRHAGIVWQVFDDGTFLSIEGNNWAGNKKQAQIKPEDDCTFYSYNGGTSEVGNAGIHSFRRKVSEIKGLIHTEELMGVDVVDYTPKYSPQLNLSDSDEDLPSGSYCLLDTKDIVVIEGANAPDTGYLTDEYLAKLNSIIPGVPNKYLAIGGGAAVLIALIAVGIKYRS